MFQLKHLLSNPSNTLSNFWDNFVIEKILFLINQHINVHNILGHIPNCTLSVTLWQLFDNGLLRSKWKLDKRGFEGASTQINVIYFNTNLFRNFHSLTIKINQTHSMPSPNILHFSKGSPFLLVWIIFQNEVFIIMSAIVKVASCKSSEGRYYLYEQF